MVTSLKISQNNGICGSIRLHKKQQNHHFEIYWGAGHTNLAGYYTNHHTVQHHK